MASEVGMEIAVVVVTASIVLAGIMIGLGRAFSYKAIEHFGIEELVQSVVNAAIIGSLAAITALVQTISSSILSTTCSTGTVITQLSCTLDNLNLALFDLFQQLARLLDLVGYYQSLSLNFGSFSISPFTNLSAVSAALSMQLLSLNVLMVLVELNREIAIFIGQNALGLIFPLGLVLRTFFATRKVGGFLLALSIGLYIFYPTFVLIFPDPVGDVQNTTAAVESFTNNTYYAAMPVIDLNGNNAIAAKLDLMSGRCNVSMANLTNMTNMSNLTPCQQMVSQFQNLSQSSNMSVDFSGDLTLVSEAGRNALSKTLLYAVVAPILSIIITIVFVRELASLLGSEVGFRTIASI